MSTKRVYCSVIGRNWDFQNLHVTQANLWAFAKGLEKEGFEIIPWKWSSNVPAEPGNFLIQPGFNLPGGKYMIATKNLMQMCKLEKRHLVLFTGDVENLHTWWPYVADNEVLHGLVTSFYKPWMAWKAQWIYHERSAHYDLAAMVPNLGPDQPKFSVGYIGWPKRKRFNVIKKVGYKSLVMMGYAADKQTEFPSAFCDVNTPFHSLSELYRACAWQACFSDDEINEVWPCVSRQFESWNCGRPCAFHTSFIEGMKEYVNFSTVSEFIFDSDHDLHRISKIALKQNGEYDLTELKRIADQQRSALLPQMMDIVPVTRRTVDYLNSEYGNLDPIKFMGNPSGIKCKVPVDQLKADTIGPGKLTAERMEQVMIRAAEFREKKLRG